MERTRKTLLFPAGYLTMAGLGMMIAPKLALALFLSDGTYEDAAIRLCGLFVLGLAVLVIQTVRLRIEALYATLVGVRVMFCAGYVVLYAMTRDPFFVVVLAMVGSGAAATAIALHRGRR